MGVGAGGEVTTLLGQAVLFDVAPVPPPVRVKRPRTRRARVTTQPQPYMRALVLPFPVEQPKTLGECTEREMRYPLGKCEAWHCRHNLVLDVRRTGSVESIVAGARGGFGVGASLASGRTLRGKVRASDVDRFVDAAVARHDALVSTCAFDYVDHPELAGEDVTARDDDTEDAPHMTLEQVGRVMGVTRERVRKIELVALMCGRADRPDLDPAFVPATDLVRPAYAGPVVRRRST